MNLRYLNSVIILLILIPLISCERSENVSPKLHRVTKVIDGDTIIINGYEKVRLIGIDTPELYSSDKLRRDSFRSGKTVRTIMALGKKSYEFTKREIKGRKVRLEADPQTSPPHKDKYGRTLAYIYRHPDDLFLNAEIIKQGYGTAYTRFPFQYLDDFREFEQEAREHRRGLWADDSLEGL